MCNLRIENCNHIFIELAHLQRLPVPDLLLLQHLFTKRKLIQLLRIYLLTNPQVQIVLIQMLSSIVGILSQETSISSLNTISLLIWSLKIITKVLTNRLQRVVQKLIHANQYGFLKARSMSRLFTLGIWILLSMQSIWKSSCHFWKWTMRKHLICWNIKLLKIFCLINFLLLNASCLAAMSRAHSCS